MMAADRQVRRMRYALFRSIMNQEMGWFDQLNPGELSNRLVTDLGKSIIRGILRFESRLLSIYLDKIRDGLGDKKADFISLICRVIGGLVFAFIKGLFFEIFLRPVLDSLEPCRMEISAGLHLDQSVDHHCLQHHHARKSIQRVIEAKAPVCLLHQVVMKYTAKEIKAFSKASAVAQEVLGSIRTVTAFGGQRKEEKR